MAIHNTVARDGREQPHAHVMVTTRRVAGEGFGKGKDREFSDKPEAVKAIRTRWGVHVNRALERANRVERVDHRSLAIQAAEARAQGDHVRAEALDRPPEPKIGPVGLKIEAEGRASYAVRRALEVRRGRQALGAVKREKVKAQT